MTGTITLLKNGHEMRTAYFSSKKQRRELSKEWEAEVKRLVKHSPYFETVLSIYELSIILNHDTAAKNL